MRNPSPMAGNPRMKRLEKWVGVWKFLQNYIGEKKRFNVYWITIGEILVV